MKPQDLTGMERFWIATAVHKLIQAELAEDWSTQTNPYVRSRLEEGQAQIVKDLQAIHKKMTDME